MHEIRPRRPATYPEHHEQRAVCVWAQMHDDRYPDLKHLFHPANEAKRSKVTAGLLKAIGLLPGVPDLILPSARGGWFGLYLEMKRPGHATRKHGDLSPAQHEFLTYLASAGYCARVAYGAEEGITILERYVTLPRTEARNAGE